MCIRDRSIPPAVIPSDEETKFYKGPNNDKLPNMKGKIVDISRQGLSLIHIFFNCHLFYSIIIVFFSGIFTVSLGKVTFNSPLS